MMAVISCNITDEHRGDENDQTRQLIELYRIQTDNEDKPSEIYDDPFPGIPRIGDPHPIDPLVTVKSRRVTWTGNRNWYTMEVMYDNNSSAQDSGGGGGGVEVLSVQVSAWYEDYILEFDVNGRPIRNSASDKIKYQSRRPHPLITVSAQTREPKMKDFLQNLGKVNSDFVSWLNGQLEFKVDQLLFDNYNAQSIGSNTWKEDFIFKARLVTSPTNGSANILDVEGKGAGQPPQAIRDAGWQPFLLDAGLFEVFIENGVKVKRPIRPVEKEGDKRPTQPVTSDWPLDSGGGAQTREQVEEGKVFYRNFQTYERFNFNLFQFDFTKVLEEKKKDR
jgi:hypothetical protein